MKKLQINQPVTFTNPINDVQQDGVVDGIETDHRTDENGEPVDVDIYQVRLNETGVLRAERSWLAERKEP